MVSKKLRVVIDGEKVVFLFRGEELRFTCFGSNLEEAKTIRDEITDAIEKIERKQQSANQMTFFESQENAQRSGAI